MTLLLAALLLSPATPPTIAPGPKATTVRTLPTSPREIAYVQFAAFYLGDVDPSLYAQPPAASDIAQYHALLQSIGRVKNWRQTGQSESNGEQSFVYRFDCEHGIALEKFSLKVSKITSVTFVRL